MRLLLPYAMKKLTERMIKKAQQGGRGGFTYTYTSGNPFCPQSTYKDYNQQNKSPKGEIEIDYVPPREEKRKGTFNAGSISLQVDILKGSAGQDMCATALDVDADYSFRAVLQNGRTFYLRGLVTGFPVNVGGANDMTSSTITIELNPIFLASGDEVAALEVTP